MVGDTMGADGGNAACIPPPPHLGRSAQRLRRHMPSTFVDPTCSHTHGPLPLSYFVPLHESLS